MGRQADGRDRPPSRSAGRETRAQLGAHRPAISGSHRRGESGPGDLPDGRLGLRHREMSSLSQSLEALHAPRTRWLWLVREMAPSDERLKVTVRMVVAAVTVVVVSMTLHVPLIWLSTLYSVFVIKENRVVTWITGVVVCLGVTIGITASLFVLRYTFDDPEYRI